MAPTLAAPWKNLGAGVVSMGTWGLRVAYDEALRDRGLPGLRDRA